jgi:hypothetical protein
MNENDWRRLLLRGVWNCGTDVVRPSRRKLPPGKLITGIPPQIAACVAEAYFGDDCRREDPSQSTGDGLRAKVGRAERVIRRSFGQAGTWRRLCEVRVHEGVATKKADVLGNRMV